MNYTAIEGARTAAVADVDGDGNLDLVIGGGGVAVLLGKGDGTFWGPAIYSIQGQALTLQVADLDQDDKPDIVVTNDYSNSMNVLRGRGYGTFDLPADYLVGPAPDGVAIADFDGDGSLDVAVTNISYAGNTVTVTLNKPVIALFPSALSFPPQRVGTTSQPKTEEISNPGSGPVRLKPVSITGKDASDFQETTACKGSLAVGRNCSIKVTFRPSAKGTRVAELKITDNALGKKQTIALRGTGQ